MKIGLNYAPIRRKDQPGAAVLADRLGYSSLWYGEHIALPYDFDASKYPGQSMTFDPESIILDPFALLAFVAGITEHVRLGTGIAILPLHDPLITARTLVTHRRVVTRPTIVTPGCRHQRRHGRTGRPSPREVRSREARVDADLIA